VVLLVLNSLTLCRTQLKSLGLWLLILVHNLQQIPSAIRGSLVSDLIVYLGSIDFVMSDVDR
jgi:hypothetical protein